MRFNRGDKIVCINDEAEPSVDMGGLTKGQTYTVRGTSMSGTVNLNEISERHWFNENRFVLKIDDEERAQKIVDLEHTVNQQTSANLHQHETIANQQKQITRLTEIKEGLDRDITNLIEAKERLAREKTYERQRYEMRLTEASDKMNALVARLHVIAQQMENEGDDAGAEEIDNTLGAFGLPTRKKTYEIIFTVPVQVRVCDIHATSPVKAREMFDAGEINWNVANYENQIDDEIKVVEIREMP